MGPLMERIGGEVYPESRVLIIMTGGTICMRPSQEGMVPVDGFLESAMSPRPSFNDCSTPLKLNAWRKGERLELPSLRTPVSAYSKHIRYCILEFTPLLDSSSISSAGWTEIAEIVKENYTHFDGFVVLHGTDSLAYSASALSFMMSDLGKPIILTGSQASIFALQSDAVDNLLGSLIIAGTFIIPEVCLFFSHTLFRGNRTTKVSASAFEAFASPNCQPLAKVTSLGVDVNWALVRRPTRIAEFNITRYLDTAHVACFRIFPGIRPEMLDSVLQVPNLKGLILETFGMGNAPGGVDGSLTKVIRNAVEREIIIVNVSQCTNGVVTPLYAPGTALERAGVVFGQDLTTEAALTKLSYLLAVDGLSVTDIRELMGKSQRGEMTEMARPIFSHPDVVPRPVSSDQESFTALGYAIGEGDLPTVRNILEHDSPRRLLTAVDYAGNTAVHLAAVGPNTDVLRELLTRGASVHVRNRGDNTPLFLAEKSSRQGNVSLLKEAGAHLWQTETREVGATPQEASGANGVNGANGAANGVSLSTTKAII
jgi:60kDa lysophospholipase